ncbi:MAG: LITAF-like zinc ribbon domain-containing protein [Acidobacteriota bacterium]
MIICVNCGQVNETAADRCLRCGASIFEYPSYLGTSGRAPSGSASGGDPPKPSPPYGPAPQPVIPPPSPMAPPLSALPTVPQVVPPLPQMQPLLIQQFFVTGGFVCPYCRTTLPPRITSRVSLVGWIMLGLLLLFCFPLFWVGLLIQEEVCRCRNCGRRLF